MHSGLRLPLTLTNACARPAGWRTRMLPACAHSLGDRCSGCSGTMKAHTRSLRTPQHVREWLLMQGRPAGLKPGWTMCRSRQKAVPGRWRGKRQFGGRSEALSVQMALPWLGEGACALSSISFPASLLPAKPFSVPSSSHRWGPGQRAQHPARVRHGKSQEEPETQFQRHVYLEGEWGSEWDLPAERTQRTEGEGENRKGGKKRPEHLWERLKDRPAGRTGAETGGRGARGV